MKSSRTEELAPLGVLPGVGPVRAARLAKLGLASVRDLLLLVPRLTEPARIADSLARARDAARDAATARVRVRGTVRGKRLYRSGWRRSVLRVRIDDASGSLDLVFFNQPWLRERFEIGQEIVCEGHFVDTGGGALRSPRLVAPDEDPSVPMAQYPLTEGIGQEFLRGLCRAACERFAAELEEPVSAERLAEHALPPLPQAVRDVHLPRDRASFEAGRRRLALERLLALQARLAASSLDARGRAAAIAVGDGEFAALCARFPAPLTSGQLRAASEIRADLARSAPMRRLLQGDVGSGKTWVAAIACLVVAQSGRQAAFLAPTELLAEQHFQGLRRSFGELGLRTALLTGSLARAARRETQAELAGGRTQVVFGTHALLSSDVRFARLALAVVDEQHRFGVAQRERLFEKGRDVHALLMTATPIPRTLALTIYGDLDTSLLDEAPPGRGGVKTRRVPPDKVEGLREFLRERTALGERVFWVCPRIEGEGGAEAAYARWKEELDGVELVHGRLSALERAERLARFRSGASKLLVGTTVVEVGVDVPEATAIAIEGAHRLGLTALHQLRGRVGRGPRPAWCFLLGDDSAAARLAALESTSDGFAIAELDLAQRGMGSLTGVRQAGFNDEGLDEVALDVRLVELARSAVRADPALRARYASPDARPRS